MRQRSTRDGTIEDVRGRFEHWRQHRKAKAAIPDELRQIVDVAPNFPEECRYVLETLGKVYLTDAQTRAELRLVRHATKLGFQVIPANAPPSA